MKEREEKGGTERGERRRKGEEQREGAGERERGEREREGGREEG